MKRLIIVPQYPTKLRYQEWWWNELPKEMFNYFDDIIVLGNSIEKDNDVETAKDGLVKAVKKGPLVVFSDTSPKKDNLVSSFQKELMQSDVKYSAYFMS